MKPLVTVITPTTGAPCLRQALDSVKNQTYHNIQHLVVVDGQPKGRVIAREYPHIDLIDLPYPTGKEHGEKGEHSEKAHDWNPRLKGYESHEESDADEYGEAPKISKVEREERGQEYKKKKASVLNYVYYGEAREAINILNNAGKLAYNGKFAPKPSATLSSMQARNVPQRLEENHVFLFDLLFGY